ncbi:uncharacterized protein [Coffea arabica]|uniref:Uncharacterized protein n=1 Tax=Coffea arabica TaxID=13443 RepID=A0ABM4VGX6_COFAR
MAECLTMPDHIEEAMGRGGTWDVTPSDEVKIKPREKNPENPKENPYEDVGNCEIWVGERKLLADLMSLAIKRYDVILGMDWLARYHTQLDCKMKLVELRISGKATLKLGVRGRLASSVLISGIRVRKLLSSGAKGYLTFLINTPEDKVKLENVPVVKKFLNVFPEKLETLPPEREIVFKIDVVPETAPISKTPYRMTPIELKELKLQLQDLLERCFIRESDSP